MPPPKEPGKLEACKRKMSEIAKAKSYGQWMTGKKHSAASLQKMRAVQKALCTPQERQARSLRAKANGYGRWMQRRTLPAETVARIVAHRRGKTYEEIYGERAEEEKQKRRESNRKAKAGKRPPHLLEFGKQIAQKRKGHSYAQIYGDAAKSEALKRQATLRQTWARRERKADRRPRHNSDCRYTDWRTAVFERDNYTCRICGRRGGALQAHHVQPWALFPDLRYEVANGFTVCADPCHKQLTQQQRRKKNCENDSD